MNHWLDILVARIICPSIEIQSPFYTDQATFTYIFTGNLCLASPNFDVKPVGLLLFGGRFTANEKVVFTRPLSKYRISGSRPARPTRTKELTI